MARSVKLWFDMAWVYSYNFAGSLGVACRCGHEIRPFEPEQAPLWAGNLRREATDRQINLSFPRRLSLRRQGAGIGASDEKRMTS